MFTTSGTLKLDDIQAFIDALETETGIQRGRYTLSITTEIRTEGSVDGLPLASEFTPSIEFDISNLEVVLKQGSADGEPALNPSKSQL
ncbi:MAG: hypothetical protein HN855_06670 [Anaerolineae bacterium]|nr:hypothetical protein [Anaerolineae bacterium]MBT7071480.1 hypothetical protein [Anaerolineae bacterium]MBT7324821.1 hypothetical protein [Anaerolineae bacterium]